MGAKGFLNWLLKALCLVLVGSAIGVITMSALVAYDSGQPPPILGAKWWEVFTAFGTVGAVIVALVFSLRTEIEKALIKKYRRKFIKTKIHSRLSLYLMSMNDVLPIIHTKEEANQLAMTRLTRLWWIEGISDRDVLELLVFYDDAHQLVHAREKILYLLKIAKVPRKFLEKDTQHYQKVFFYLKESNVVDNLDEICATLERIKLDMTA